MYIYAGIDEAGYGPMFGPLLVGRAVFCVPNLEPDAPLPHLWQRLSRVVCRNLSGRKGRIAVNDSKKLTSPAAGIKHLELGCLAFAALAGHRPASVDQWLDCLGDRSHHDLGAVPWYQPTDQSPWGPLPAAVTPGQVAIAQSMLARTATRIGVQVPDLGAAVVFEDRFNRMVRATRSKAATSFTFVAGHLLHLWQRFGKHHPIVVVDRQGGRTKYRHLLAMNFPDANITILDQTQQRSGYRLESVGPAQPDRVLTVWFEVDADQTHMPVALASMISKYTRELLMARFNAFFNGRVPQVRPTAGYARDAKRFWAQIQPHLPALAIRSDALCRMA